MADPIVLDLYCSAGGVGLALQELGIPHVGVDIENYSDTYTGDFIQADASDIGELKSKLKAKGLPTKYKLVWGSPPCLAYTPLSHVNASRWGWDESPKERYPTIPELNVREVCNTFGEEYIIENVSQCDDLWNPVELNGHAFNLGIEARHKFETSFQVFSAVESGTAEVQFGKHNKRDELADVKDVPKEWSLEEINSAIPKPYVQYLLHYCPAIANIPLPAMQQDNLSRWQ